MTPSRNVSTGRVFRVAAIFLMLSACRGHGAGKFKMIWTCKDYPGGGCHCVGNDAKDVPGPETLCKLDYECCIYKLQGADSQVRTSCECWNPSLGGPTCESKLPKEPNWLWNRVEKCQ